MGGWGSTKKETLCVDHCSELLCSKFTVHLVLCRYYLELDSVLEHAVSYLSFMLTVLVGQYNSVM